jgi:hypothetical protein
MKIQRHPRMHDISVGDEVLSYRTNMYARVEEVFPAAVCVKLAAVCQIAGRFETREIAQLWRADEIENLSRCCYCGTRDDLAMLQQTHTPQRVCTTCRSVLRLSHADVFAEALAPYDETAS